MVIKQENFWGENIFVTSSTRTECFRTTRVAMTHRGIGVSVHVTLGWYLSLQFTETRPNSMRKKFLPRIISQALLQLRHDDLKTMAQPPEVHELITFQAVVLDYQVTTANIWLFSFISAAASSSFQICSMKRKKWKFYEFFRFLACEDIEWR